MKNSKDSNYEYGENDSKSLKEYLLLVRNNLFPFVLIAAVCFAVAVLYALSSKDIYESETVLKISKPSGNILNIADNARYDGSRDGPFYCQRD